MMKLSKLVFSFTAAFTALAGSAQAADWNGPYVGFTIGETQAKSYWSADGHYAPVAGILPIRLTSNSTAAFGDREVSWGFYTGYNWLLDNNLLAGAEFTFRDRSGDAKQSGIPGSNMFANPAPFPRSSVTADAEWDASIRARVGKLVTPSALVYAAAGLAFERLNLSGDCPRDTNVCNPGTPPKHESESSTEAGWTLGLGVESAVAENLSLRLEYDYADYGSTEFTAVRIIPGQAFGIHGKVENTAQSVTAGITYKF